MSRQPSSDFFESELTHLVQLELNEAWRDLPEPDPTVMEQHKAAFIAAGVRLAQQAKWLHLQLLSKTAFRYAAIILLTLISTFAAARVASTHSVPGDRLYPVKLSLESVESLSYQGETWKTEQERRRLSEVLVIAARGGNAVVNFEATPLVSAEGQWYVSTVPLVLSVDHTRTLANQCPQRDNHVGFYAEVRDGKIYVRAITPSCLNIASR